MKALGICLGASNVSLALLKEENDNSEVIEHCSVPHEGNPKQTLLNLIDKYYQAGYQIAITGRKFKSLVDLPQVSEPEATELAYEFVKEKHGSVEAVVSAGGETFLVYQMGSKGQIVNVYTGNKCASGTGEFFLQQIKRMNMSIEEAVAKGKQGTSYQVAGRCSVFCKSDCTHALNKGEPKPNVVAGLCEMMATKIVELLNKCNPNRVMVVGGTAQNDVMIKYLKEDYPQVIIPQEASYFEALGAALYALEQGTNAGIDSEDLFKEEHSSFTYLPRLQDYAEKVSFKDAARGVAQDNDRCLVGLDVGSTTTKAVVMRCSDNAILASVYLRTNGDPVNASRECYRSLAEQIKTNIQVVGLGVTGSGRQIAGLHALTKGIVNEIIAHAAAAVHFDPAVETIFEIGGQDAKYTYITNKVPSDYAMNEACSAGTGSFLEESAFETMGIAMEDIAELAMKSKTPPNFNDQCAAFISSDIKTAVHEGISTEDILAGLVFSICLNYLNRVKGNRAVGKKVFMQGGVCYNRAVPIAMAALMDSEIIVPPEPGLMGAFGVALDIKEKLELGLLEEQLFDLNELAERQVDYGTPFICQGGQEKCDRKCQINMVLINGQKYPFGGACNKYYNLRGEASYDTRNLNLVKVREELIFNEFAAKNLTGAKRIGLIKSLLTNSLYPLYSHFFTELGLKVVLVADKDDEALERRGAAFCYPVELSHGMIGKLLKTEVDTVFLPHIKRIFVEDSDDVSITCPFVQGEPYYLQTAFPELKELNVISPVLDCSAGYGAMEKDFIAIAKSLGYSTNKAKSAYSKAVSKQEQAFAKMRQIGQETLAELEKQPDTNAIVLFGRPYNAFAKEANMGIPHKFASRGYKIIPCDFLPVIGEKATPNMYWAMGQTITKAAAYLEKHPQLFGAYITNFSCGPDSFLVGYFRDIMGQKPSLTLELDSHSADAGVDTRIEAFLDVVKSYQELIRAKNVAATKFDSFRAAQTLVDQGKLYVVDSQGSKYSLTDPKVHLLVPSMGEFGSKALTATFRSQGINASTLSNPDKDDLQVGRENSSCKECLPLQLTVGALLNYLENRTSDDEVVVYFMPDTSGPCRFGQYKVLIDKVIAKHKLANVTTLALTSENSYAGLGMGTMLQAWHAVVATEILDEVRSVLLALAVDKQNALKLLAEVQEQVLQAVSTGKRKAVEQALGQAAQRLEKVRLRASLASATKVLLVGEIYVRSDAFSRRWLVENLAQRGIVCKVAPISEWLYYTDYIVKNRLSSQASFTNRVKSTLTTMVKARVERKLKNIFRNSKVYDYHLIDVDRAVAGGAEYLNPALTGEGILTIGSALAEIVEHVDGVISIGPFGCMPGRIAEAILTEKMGEGKFKMAQQKDLVAEVLAEFPHLPFLPIESDGSAFPPVIEAKLESFCLQVRRLNDLKATLTQ